MEAIVEHNYDAQEDDELTLRKGDIITEIKMMLGGWWEGTLKNKRGMFPDNFVKVLDSAATSGGSSGSNSETMSKPRFDKVTLKGSGRHFCKVEFRYEPCNEDELALVPDDSIEFLGEMEEGWWRGRLNNRVGVFPSNFVSFPVPEEQEKHKDRDKKEVCKVLFPYEAANEDELTLLEGEIVTLLSKDAPDKGWWKGELKGQIGLFPDNFVKIIDVNSEHETISVNVKTNSKHSYQIKKSEKAHVRKSLDAKNVHSNNKPDHSSAVESNKKNVPSSSSVLLSSLTGNVGGSDKKAVGGHSIISSLKRLVSDVGNNNGTGNTSAALGEELDGVERGEGTPLSHLTASRAKAPRRRPPSSRHLRHHANKSANISAPPTLTSPPNNVDVNVSNGRDITVVSVVVVEEIPDEETDGVAAKARKKAPWVEELKMNQKERKKNATTERGDKDVKKERILSWKTQQVTLTDSDDELNTKQNIQKVDTSPHTDNSPAAPSEQPAYVPYALYSKLLERVTALEEKQAVLQQTVGQLSKMLVPLLANSSVNSKV